MFLTLTDSKTAKNIQVEKILIEVKVFTFSKGTVHLMDWIWNKELYTSSVAKLTGILVISGSEGINLDQLIQIIQGLSFVFERVDAAHQG